MQKKITVLIILLFLYVIALGRSITILWNTNQTASVVAGIVGVLLIPFVAIKMLQPSKKIRQLESNGIEAPATIEKITDTNLTMGTSYVFRVQLLIEPSGAAPFQAELENSFPRSALPRVGDKLTVRYNPNDLTAIAIVK